MNPSPRHPLRTDARLTVVAIALTLAIGVAGCGSGGSGPGTTGAPRHFESGPQVERITKDLEVIDEACRVVAGPAALKAAHDLGALIAAGPDDTYGPATADETLADLGRIAARKAACAHTPALRAALRELGT